MAETSDAEVRLQLQPLSSHTGLQNGHNSSRQQTPGWTPAQCLPAAGLLALAVGALFVASNTLPQLAGTQLLDMLACPGPQLEPAPRLEPWNIAFSARLTKEVDELDAAGGVDTVFYGDSITETWRGSDQGATSPRCSGVPEIFERYFGIGKGRRAQVLAVGGDQVAHLTWRLMHGQTYKVHQPKVAVVMIGTNDLGAAACFGYEHNVTAAAPAAALRLQTAVQYLRLHNPNTSIVLAGLTPRGGFFDTDRFAWPSAFTAGLHTLNAWQEQMGSVLPGVEYADCSTAVLRDGKILPSVMPDGLHPVAAGMESLAQCLAPIVDKHFDDV